MLALGFGALLIITSCKTTKDASANLSIDYLTATAWELTEINGKAVSTADFGNGAPTATFTAEHKINGKGGCNGYGGAWNLNDEGGMNISEVMSTKMWCENAKGENDYFKALAEVTTAKVEKDKLTLMKGVNAVLVFKPAAAK
ncbi:Heat shock protein HslJ [Flavobacterium akiainvivens]|nr:Heat shock protein HslJ [Flavobacterium akiainvivens]